MKSVYFLALRELKIRFKSKIEGTSVLKDLVQGDVEIRILQ